MIVVWLALTVAAYLLGSVPFGYVVSRFIFGVNIRRVGSGNIGATNVYRNLGWGAALLTAVGDIGKGVVPVLLARSWGSGPQWAAVVGLAVVLGHCCSIFLGFKGGKGVSTTIAALAALYPPACLVFVLVWIVVLLLQGRVSVASLAAAASMPLLVGFMYEVPQGVLLFVWTSAIIIFVRHRENIDRILAGTEKPMIKPLKLFGD